MTWPAQHWNERQVFKYIRSDKATLTELITPKFQGTLHLEEGATNWEEMTKMMSKVLSEVKELRKTISKVGGQLLTNK